MNTIFILSRALVIKFVLVIYDTKRNVVVVIIILFPFTSLLHRKIIFFFIYPIFSFIFLSQVIFAYHQRPLLLLVVGIIVLENFSNWNITQKKDIKKSLSCTPPRHLYQHDFPSCLHFYVVLLSSSSVGRVSCIIIIILYKKCKIFW